MTPRVMHGSQSLIGQCQRNLPARAKLGYLPALPGDPRQQLRTMLPQFYHSLIHGSPPSCSLSLVNSARLAEKSLDLARFWPRNNTSTDAPKAKKKTLSTTSTAKR